MNQYTFEEIEIGHKETFTYEINEEKMNQFLFITNDINPLHNDLEYAKENGYPEKVVYGMLTSSALSTLAGVYLPGKYSLIHSIKLTFNNPVFLSNCPLNVIGEVVEKDERFKTIKVKFTILDKNDKKVSKGFMEIGVIK